MSDGWAADAAGNEVSDEILRGWETVRLNKLTQQWEPVAKWRPTELAIRQATSDLKRSRERFPNETYEIRALVSVRAPQETRDVGKLVLDADEVPEPTEE